ncbi:glycosyltransferase [Bacillus sp. JJ722]|uniref:glycosyltransferase n=1 Tax=Bacillus sp. JJ722 TaxID=3122973 RepID=UPI002FFE54EA
MKLAIIDTVFPWKQSGFRYWENMKFQEIHSDVFFFATYKHTDEFPKKVFHISQFRDISRKENITHIYCVFLNLALSLIGKTHLPDGTVIAGGLRGIDLSDVIRERNIKLSTTLYPGGGLDPSTSPEFIKIIKNNYDKVFTNIDEVLAIIPEAMYIPGISNTELYEYNPKVKDKRIELIFCAHNGIRKGFSTVAKAFNQLDNSFHLHIIGNWEGELYQLSNPNFTFYGPLNPDMLVQIYKKTHVFINASFQDQFALDGFPTTSAMDAMSTGCMLLTTNPRNDSYILKENVEYLKFEVRNDKQLVHQLNWVKQNFAEAMNIGINGSEAIRTFYDAKKNAIKKLKFISG